MRLQAARGAGREHAWLGCSLEADARAALTVRLGSLQAAGSDPDHTGPADSRPAEDSSSWRAAAAVAGSPLDPGQGSTIRAGLYLRV